jgi:hypothetical protein
MFIYDLDTKVVLNGDMPSKVPINTHPISREAIHQSGDAVVAVFPFKYPDSFDFRSKQSTPILIEGKDSDNSTESMLELAQPVMLDPTLISLKVTSSKEGHQSVLTAMLLDPNGTMLGRINPGDWIVCWMFNDMAPAAKLRKDIKDGKYDNHNDFYSGLKFIGKVVSNRMAKDMSSATGIISRRTTILASSFSELDLSVYYDPALLERPNDFDYFTTVANTIAKRVANPTEVSAILAIFLTALMGFPVDGNKAASPNRPVQVPNIIAKLLGREKTDTSYLDLLNVHIGIQDFGDSYLPKLGRVAQDVASKSSIQSPHRSIFFAPKSLRGFIDTRMDPMSNIPLWSFLEQYSIPLANEMYVSLRMGVTGTILPHLIIRQRPLNTDDFVGMEHTKYRTLPRWRISDNMITSFNTGKSNTVKANYVQVQPTGAEVDVAMSAGFRTMSTPRWDTTDIARHGLRPLIKQVNSTISSRDPFEVAQAWTDLLTDWTIGGHLRLSGNMNSTGIEEPIAVGDNLEYEGIVYHIEQLEHTVTANPSAGTKSFSTSLAFSHGMPAVGIAFPEITTRRFDAAPYAPQWVDSLNRPTLQLPASNPYAKNKSVTGTGHSNTPPSTFESD